MRWLNGFNGRKNILLGVLVCIAMAFSVSVNAAPDWPSYLGPNNDLQPEIKNLRQQQLRKYGGRNSRQVCARVTIAEWASLYHGERRYKRG